MFTWRGEVHRQRRAVFIHVSIGDVMGPNEIDCAQLHGKAHIGEGPLQSKAEQVYSPGAEPLWRLFSFVNSSHLYSVCVYAGGRSCHSVCVG